MHLNRKRVLTFGTFDLFHFGHLKLLERAATYGDELFVGISSDKLNFSKKNRYPIMNEIERAHIVAGLKFVNSVFLEESLELKREYLKRYNADILIMGDDWAGKFDEFKDICEVIYLPRTQNISTSELLQRIKNDFQG
ncbi:MULTISPECIES: adenylyltransferase/cytidyltransferase family protein [unclassified Campylobacter]|uniref:adenylyltransferase/cytidyltransferase family protein n=1 Tax=unclassified Campylobacter TaxID=2593542 RepID=UPI0012380979|nr:MULTISPECIES: adenylyltransferase/cytidyltransferase family protein [unclassified Campylobacter]KAA6224774.1 adenylyltransferase/cytidyltransferase family protein [Campylobacter sp. LR286c]KAA6225251.1 adenylyltransferase/cytidyltransferase family protein [Campylobacter sp. LR185c]KAA6227779.1 adenylyltransferase/cytidyltransferase family protein [Campylobacter sp. LR196d]KAA6233621.1 adenylyltransferase/cytidyltransferase family protein [Campylobacter sp. LR291e]KAA6234383.1 adenylyltransf